MQNNEDRKKAILRLLENKDFQDVILDGFIKEGVLTIALNENVRSEAVSEAIMARNILHNWIFAIIGNGETP